MTSVISRPNYFLLSYVHSVTDLRQGQVGHGQGKAERHL